MTVVVSDLEGTLTTGTLWRGFRSYFKRNGSKLAYNLFFLSQVPAYQLVRLGLRDEQSMKSNWTRREIRLLRGASPAEVDAMAHWVVEQEMWPGRRLEVLAEIEKHRAAGARLVIATGAYQPVAETFARRLEAEAVGTPLAYQDGKLVGLASPVSVQSYKAENVRAYLGDESITAAYGDTASDVPMMELSAMPVAVYPNAELRLVAEERGWRILDDTGGDDAGRDS